MAKRDTICIRCQKGDHAKCELWEMRFCECRRQQLDDAHDPANFTERFKAEKRAAQRRRYG